MLPDTVYQNLEQRDIPKIVTSKIVGAGFTRYTRNMCVCNRPHPIDTLMNEPSVGSTQPLYPQLVPADKDEDSYRKIFPPQHVRSESPRETRSGRESSRPGP